MNPMKDSIIQSIALQKPTILCNSFKMWIPNRKDMNQYSKVEYLEMLSIESKSIYTKLKKRMEDDAQKTGSLLENAYPSGWCTIFYMNNGVLKVLKYFLRGVSAINITPDGVTVEVSRAIENVSEPVCLIQDFFGRSIILDGYGTYIYDPMEEIVKSVKGTIKVYSFNLRGVMTPACIQISFWSLVNKSIDCTKTKAIKDFNEHLSSIHVSKVLRDAMNVEIYEFGDLAMAEYLDPHYKEVVKHVQWIKLCDEPGVMSLSITKPEPMDVGAITFSIKLATCRIVYINFQSL